MERTVLYADTGMMLTNGSVFGKVTQLAEGQNGAAFTQITEEQYLQIFANGAVVGQATEKDYQASLAEFGVKI